MKASERLRELDGAIPSGPWLAMPHHDANAAVLTSLRNALPLIADVVEAAEDGMKIAYRAALVGDHPELDDDSTKQRYLREDATVAATKSRAALTALRDALEAR